MLKLEDYQIDYAELPVDVPFYAPKTIKYQLIVTADGKEAYNVLTESLRDLEEIYLPEVDELMTSGNYAYL